MEGGSRKAEAGRQPSMCCHPERSESASAVEGPRAVVPVGLAGAAMHTPAPICLACRGSVIRQGQAGTTLPEVLRLALADSLPLRMTEVFAGGLLPSSFRLLPSVLLSCNRSPRWPRTGLVTKSHPILLLAAAGLALGVPLRPTTADAADAPAAANPPALTPADMDLSVKPGDDFYHYAGGTWLKDHPVPPDQTRWGSFNILIEHNKDVLHGILDDCAAAAAKGGDDAPAGSNKQKVGDFYASGMDETTIEADGVRPLAPYFAKIDTLKDAADLPALLAAMHKSAVGSLFELRRRRRREELRDRHRPTWPGRPRPARPRLLPARRRTLERPARPVRAARRQDVRPAPATPPT